MAGYGMVSLAVAIFFYYTIWVVVLVSREIPYVYMPGTYFRSDRYSRIELYNWHHKMLAPRSLFYLYYRSNVSLFYLQHTFPHER